MTYSPLSIKRSYVLGNLYDKCEPIESIPVYLLNTSDEMIGYVSESSEPYADAFVFHIPEDICKKLSSGSYGYGLDYDYASDNKITSKRKIKLNHIVLMSNRIETSTVS